MHRNWRGMILLLVLFVAAAVVVVQARKTVMIFALAYGFSFLLEPVVQKLEQQGIKRTWGTLWLYGASIFVLFGLITMGASYLRLEILRLKEQLPHYLQTGQRWLEQAQQWYMENIPFPMPVLRLEEKMLTAENDIVLFLKEGLQGISALMSGGIVWLLVPIVGFYFIKDKDKVCRAFYLLLPIRRQREWQILFWQIGDMIRSFLKGSILVCTAVAICTAIGLWMVGVKFSILFGVIAGVFNIIPYFGPIIGGVPAVAMAILQEPTKGIWAVVVIFLVQQIESHFITPKIMGERLHLHPLVIIFVLLAGGSLFGIWGMLLAVPFAGVMRILLPFMIAECVREID